MTTSKEELRERENLFPVAVNECCLSLLHQGF